MNGGRNEFVQFFVAEQHGEKEHLQDININDRILLKWMRVKNVVK
jgi:ferritin